jgi:glycosyltransferase involved in cell wall biosynthesis
MDIPVNGSDRRISAVIPTYNRAGLVERAIDSVLSQTHPPEEVVVIDDGSTDDTEERLVDYHPLVRYIKQENGGDAIARNSGVAAATSEWVAFLDSDDAWTVDHLARMAAALDATSGEADFYFADTQLAPYDGGPSTRVWDDARFTIAGDHEFIADATAWAILPIQPMMLQSSMFNRDTFLAAGGMTPLPVRADTHFFYAMSLGRPVCAVAGIGAVMTADDSDTRLTARFDEQGSLYWTSSVSMYRDILRREPDLSRETVAFFESAEAVAHWRLARLSWASRDLRTCARHLVPSFRLDPRAFVGRFRPGR